MTLWRQALVCGLGASGLAAARLLRREDTIVIAIDGGDSPALRETARQLEAEGVTVLLGATKLPGDAFEVAVMSPSIALGSAWATALRQRNIPLLAELELGWSRHRGKTMAVTGSNGKSTCVKWLAEALQAVGLQAVPAGNYGVPVTQVVCAQPNLDWLVLEVSTFQLETCREFRPDVGILLNIHPNHLDRHGDMATYTALKARMFSSTQVQDACLAPRPWLESVRALSGGHGRWISFGLEERADWRFHAGQIWQQGRVVANLRGTHFANDILGQTGAAVMAALHAANVDLAYGVQAAQAFQPLRHRMQLVDELGGVRWINDSKATNLAALKAALQMTSGRIRLIAGGLIKEKDLGVVKDLLAQKVETVYLIGRAAPALAQAWSGAVRCRRSGDLAVAVEQAGADVRAGEVVLLSPACASFDQFRSFEERGDRFADLVAARRKKMESAKGKGRE